LARPAGQTGEQKMTDELKELYKKLAEAWTKVNEAGAAIEKLEGKNA